MDAGRRGMAAAQPGDDTLRGEVVGGVSAIRSERARSTGRRLQPDRRPGRGAVSCGARAASAAPRADLFPTVTVGASATRSRASSTRARRASVGRWDDRRLPAADRLHVLEADLWGRVRRNVEASVARRPGDGGRPRDRALSSHAELAMDYFQLRGLDAQSALLDKTVDGYERALELTPRGTDQGVASGVDVAQAPARSSRRHAVRRPTFASRARSSSTPSRCWWAKPPADLTIPPAESSMFATGRSPWRFRPSSLERRPDVAAAERRVAAANAQIGVARLLLSAVTLTAGGGPRELDAGDTADAAQPVLGDRPRARRDRLRRRPPPRRQEQAVAEL